MTRKEAENLLSKYERGLCNEEEIAWIETWYIQLNEAKTLNLDSAAIEAAEARMMRALNIHDKPTVALWKKVAVAASIIILSGLGIYFFQLKEVTNQPAQANLSDVIKPGGNKAVLILGDGRKINLEETATGKLAEEFGVNIIKKASGEIVYDMRGTKSAEVASKSVNTIATPRGGTYHVLLEDGSKVWLNAASSITFPASFEATERKVELQGEAYFEIAKNRTRPFIVKAGNQSIQVLGTKFNVNSYTNEPNLKTTLVEGSVKVSNQIGSLILKPGQQSQSTAYQKITLREVETEEFLAWKDGMFSFQRADLKTVMKQFERWYDIDVQFEDELPDMYFTGKIYRNLNLNEALNSLTFLGVKFKIQHRNVTVLSK